MTFRCTSAQDQTIVNQFKRQLTLRGLKALRLVLRMALWAPCQGKSRRFFAECSAEGFPF